MEGKVHRATYNMIDGVAILRLENGSVCEVKMSPDKWRDMLKGDVRENFNRLLNE